MTKEFKESYIEAWKKSAQETLDDPRIKEYLSHFVRTGVDFPLDIIFDELDNAMKGYASDWSDLSDKHRESGLYTKIAEFISEKEGVILDLGCGNCNLIDELDGDRMIGVDLNSYCLQLGENLLAGKGKKVSAYAKSYISFDPEKGFILKPHPLVEPIDLDGINLICDDITTMHNTMRVLYNDGRKADIAIFTLAGGIGPYKRIEFFEIVKKLNGMENDIDKGIRILSSVLDNIHKVCKKDGRLYLAIRALKSHDADFLASFEGINFDKMYGSKLEIIRQEYIPLIDESGANGIHITPRLMNPNDKFTKEQEKVVNKIGYDAVLLECIVKTD